MKKYYLGMVCAILFSLVSYAQDDYSELLQNYLKKNSSSFGLVERDISNLKVVNQYYTKSMDLEHVYVQQEIYNIPVFNAIGNFAVKDGEVVYFSNNFEINIHQRTNSAEPSITASEAISSAAKQLGINASSKIKLISSKNLSAGQAGGEYVFSAPEISRKEISVNLVYQPMKEENLRLAWNLSIHTLDGKHLWSIRVDATTGKIIDKDDWVVSCFFPSENIQTSGTSRISNSTSGFGKAPLSIVGDGSQYEVFALPLESPNHGTRSIVVEPSDIVASPYGWHDVDGLNGAEYTITRGNNVWASEDRIGNSLYGPPSPGNSPDGGNSLDFSFPLDLTQNPYAYTAAATTNLFYMVNKSHDIWYHYGFDEASGNFQETNYSGNGSGSDPVVGLAQAGADIGPLNNAFFTITPEGTSPAIVMFTWNYSGPSHLLTINGTGTLAGTYPAIPAQIGPDFPTTPLTADLALIEDDNSGTSTDPYDACDVITNASSLSGKIVVIRRGQCSFTDKITKAENAGAKAVIMVNDDFSTPIAMGGGANTIGIPSIMIAKSDGDAIINSLIAGNTINATFENSGPYIKDGDFDNGIIAHEYGHGISSRLTGGASNPGCLTNDEQMGEGWSDFFGLALTIKTGDQGTDARGYGTYAVNQGVNGSGIRQYRYSTDMSVNPFTYADIQNFVFSDGSVNAHAIGSVWATMLWDLTWALIDRYGFDPDMYNGTGGNNIAMQLVIDGLKLQPCSPGFVDGRDAILQADMLANGGANQCLIWEVFANRGLGYSAIQGLSTSAVDQTEAFDMPPTSVLACTQGTSDFNNENSFKIYPNPANGHVNIASHKINGEIRVLLYDINGRKILDKMVDLNRNAQIDVSGLNAGIYVMHIISDGKTQTEKLIVN